MLVTIDYFRFNDILSQMVLLGQISNEEREELLHKAGLLKLNRTEWSQGDDAILTLGEPQDILERTDVDSETISDDTL